MNEFNTLIVHPTEPAFLALRDSAGWRLPTYRGPRWTPEIGELVVELEATLARRVVIRQCLHVDIDRSRSPETRRALYLASSPRDPQPEAGVAWVDASQVQLLADGWCRERVAAFFAQAPVPTAPWGRGDWYGEICAWLERTLEGGSVTLNGLPRQLKQWDLSSILTVGSSAGALYIKCVPAMFSSEARVTSALARLFPNDVPGPLALHTTPDEGRLLLLDFRGTLVRRTSSPELGMLTPLRRLAEMQVRCASLHVDLLALGCHDRRLTSLPADLERVLADALTTSLIDQTIMDALRELAPEVERDCRELLALPVPQSLVHGDFHNGNVAVTAGGHVLFDWSDASFSHPFFDLAVALGGAEHAVAPAHRQPLLDAYLEPWQSSGYGDRAQIERALEIALRLGPLYHAVSYHQILLRCGQASRTELEPALRELLALGAHLLTRDLEPSGRAGCAGGSRGPERRGPS